VDWLMLWVPQHTSKKSKMIFLPIYLTRRNEIHFFEC
jgi:hypothetical protein